MIWYAPLILGFDTLLAYLCHYFLFTMTSNNWYLFTDWLNQVPLILNRRKSYQIEVENWIDGWVGTLLVLAIAQVVWNTYSLLPCASIPKLEVCSPPFIRMSRFEILAISCSYILFLFPQRLSSHVCRPVDSPILYICSYLDIYSSLFELYLISFLKDDSRVFGMNCGCLIVFFTLPNFSFLSCFFFRLSSRFLWFLCRALFSFLEIFLRFSDNDKTALFSAFVLFCLFRFNCRLFLRFLSFPISFCFYPHARPWIGVYCFSCPGCYF